MATRVDRNKRAEIRMRKKVVQDILTSVPDYIQKVRCDTTTWTQPFKCAVASCRNVFQKYGQNTPYKFHNFPQNSLLKQWLEKCKVGEGVDPTLIKICTDHFTPDDYERNFKAELKDPLFKRELKSIAVPSQLLNGPEIKSDYSITVTLDVNFTEEVRTTVDENERLKKHYQKLCNEKLELEKSLRIYDAKLSIRQNNFRRVKYKCEKLRSLNKEMPENSLLRVLSQSQINVLLGKKKVFWTNDDMAMAFTLRHLGGKQCYLYLKDCLKLPLPALSSVQKWAASK